MTMSPARFRDAAGERHARNRGVSPVIGSVLMVAIVGLLAAVVGTMALGFNDSLSEPAPMANFEGDYDPAGEGNGGLAYVNLTFDSGQTLDGNRVYVVDSDGNRELWVNIWYGGPNVEPGSFVHIDGRGSDCALNAVSKGEVYRVVWEKDSGEQDVIAEYTVEASPDTVTQHDCP